MVTVFRVVQLKDEKTGGVRPVGRALVQDYKLGGNPFEINSLMQEVFAGENKIELSFSLTDQVSRLFLRTRMWGKHWNLARGSISSGKLTEEKSLLIEKHGPPPNGPRTENFHYLSIVGQTAWKPATLCRLGKPCPLDPSYCKRA